MKDKDLSLRGKVTKFFKVAIPAVATAVLVSSCNTDASTPNSTDKGTPLPQDKSLVTPSPEAPVKPPATPEAPKQITFVAKEADLDKAAVDANFVAEVEKSKAAEPESSEPSYFSVTTYGNVAGVKQVATTYGGYYSGKDKLPSLSFFGPDQQTHTLARTLYLGPDGPEWQFKDDIGNGTVVFAYKANYKPGENVDVKYTPPAITQPKITDSSGKPVFDGKPMTLTEKEGKSQILGRKEVVQVQLSAYDQLAEIKFGSNYLDTIAELHYDKIEIEGVQYDSIKGKDSGGKEITLAIKASFNPNPNSKQEWFQYYNIGQKLVYIQDPAINGYYDFSKTNFDNQIDHYLTLSGQFFNNANYEKVKNNGTVYVISLLDNKWTGSSDKSSSIRIGNKTVGPYATKISTLNGTLHAVSPWVSDNSNSAFYVTYYPSTYYSGYSPSQYSGIYIGDGLFFSSVAEGESIRIQSEAVSKKFATLPDFKPMLTDKSIIFNSSK